MNEPQSTVARGMAFEVAIAERLALLGWTCWRTVGSRGTGAVDIVCAMPGRWALLSVRIQNPLGGFDRERLVEMAKYLSAEAVEVFQTRGHIAFIQRWPKDGSRWESLPRPDDWLGEEHPHNGQPHSISTRVLELLRRHPWITATEVADALGIKRNSSGATLLRHFGHDQVIRTDTYPAKWAVKPSDVEV